MTIYDFGTKIKRAFYRIFVVPSIKISFKRCGKKVSIGLNCRFYGINNICVGNDVALGDNTRIITTKANVILGNHVMLGPGVSIISGNHRYNLPNCFMSQVNDSMKETGDDKDVILCDDVWVGSNVTILKGVTIGEGSIIAAGSVVTRDVPGCSIYGGVPARFIKKRFSDEEEKQYRAFLNSKKTKNE